MNEGAEELVNKMTAHDPNWFRQVLGHYPTGVCIITASGADEVPVGLTVGSFTSVSLTPPLVGFFPDRSSTSWPKVEAAGRFCVNVLSARQNDVCRQFALKGGNKFDGITFRTSPNGSPIIKGCVAWIDCDLYSVHEAGDHYVVLGEVKELALESAELPLLFCQGSYGAFAPLAN